MANTKKKKSPKRKAPAPRKAIARRAAPAPARRPSAPAPKRRTASVRRRAAHDGSVAPTMEPVERGIDLGLDAGIGYFYEDMVEDANASKGEHFLLKFPALGQYGRTAAIAISSGVIAHYADPTEIVGKAAYRASKALAVLAGAKAAHRKRKTQKLGGLTEEALKTEVGAFEIDADVDSREDIYRKAAAQLENARRLLEDRIESERARRRGNVAGDDEVSDAEEVSGEVGADDFAFAS